MPPLTFKSVPITVSHDSELAKQINKPCVGRCNTLSLLR
jgi:hypothetical protein